MGDLYLYLFNVHGDVGGLNVTDVLASRHEDAVILGEHERDRDIILQLLRDELSVHSNLCLSEHVSQQ